MESTVEITHKTMKDKILKYLAKLLLPYLPIDGLEERTKDYVRNYHKNKSVRLMEMEEQVRLNRKRGEKLELDFAQFGSLISEVLRISSNPNIKDEVSRDKVEQLTRDFFTK